MAQHRLQVVLVGEFEHVGGVGVELPAVARRDARVAAVLGAGGHVDGGVLAMALLTKGTVRLPRGLTSST